MGTCAWVMDSMLFMIQCCESMLTDQSRVNELVVSQAGSEFHAGGTVEHSPKISHDGKALHLDAELYDFVDDFIIQDDFIDQFAPLQLRKLLVALLSVFHLSTVFSEQRLSPIDALSRVLLGDKEQDYPQLFQHASSWLCHTLAFAVFTHLYLERLKQYENSPRRNGYTNSTNDSFADLLVNYHKQKNKTIDELLDLFEKILDTFPNHPWPEWSRAPRKFDMDTHVEYLGELSEVGQFDSRPAGSSSDQTFARIEALFTRFAVSEVPMLQILRVTMGEEASVPCPPRTKKKLQSTQFDPLDREVHAHLTKLAKSALAGRNVFVKCRGYIGYGPKWLLGGESIMLVGGADVPYVFTPLKEHQRARARQLRLEMDENDEEYYTTKIRMQTTKKPSMLRLLDSLWHERQQGRLKRLDEEKLKLKHRYDQISNSVEQDSAFVLRGEVYIEGIMNREGVGFSKRERVTIV
jgi:hypothetical protein